MQKDAGKDKDAQVKDLFKIGAHFGYSRARRHPSTGEFIFGYKNKTAVIDLSKSLEALEKAKEFVQKIASEGKQVLFVGTKNEGRSVVKKYAGFIGQPFVTERWIGGAFTNFKEIRRRIDKMKDYRAKEKAGELDIYTKRERTMIGIERTKMEKYFSGIEDMEKMPGAMVVIDSDFEKIAMAEAKQLKVPIIGLSGSDCDIRFIEYPIVANDSAKASIEFFVSELVEAYKAGKTAAQTAAQEAVKS
ncbi:MAG: 30S ribosomal protein S2 [Candidatus Vogelbacteria bacterium]|nr:30S ribosomal protein S2 [Candidatus Vogelbacteria bacterium]